MNIDGLDIRDLFRDGILTANAVRIILEEEREYYEATEEIADIISPERAEFIERRKRGEKRWLP